MAAHEIYARELGQLQHGEALWVPEPNGYDETRVGDVGYIVNGVLFNKLFNVIATADDPINLGFEVPDDFEPLVLRPNTLYKNDKFFRPGAYHGYSISRFDIGASITGSAAAGIGIQFQASDTQGASFFSDERRFARMSTMPDGKSLRITSGSTTKAGMLMLGNKISNFRMARSCS
jgi:hypothetical protein